jgi:hypothetical protein
MTNQNDEGIIEQRRVDLGAVAGWATTRNRLLILRALDTAEAADRAAFAWSRLSNESHLHAFGCSLRQRKSSSYAGWQEGCCLRIATDYPRLSPGWLS